MILLHNVACTPAVTRPLHSHRAARMADQIRPDGSSSISALECSAWVNLHARFFWQSAAERVLLLDLLDLDIDL